MFWMIVLIILINKMQQMSLYPEQNDLKNYLEKVGRVFQKMEKDLSSYRLKNNDPEKLLKMLRKRAQISELIFENLFQNLVEEQNNEYAMTFQQIDKFLQQHSNQVVAFVNSYFRQKKKLSREQSNMVKNVKTEGHQQEEESEDVASQLQESMIEKVEEEKEQFRKSMSVRFNLKNEGSETVSSNAKSPMKRQSTMNALTVMKMENGSQGGRKSIAQQPSQRFSIQRPAGELEKKMKEMVEKCQVQTEQIQDLEEKMEQIYKEKKQLQKNFENLRKTNEQLMVHMQKQQQQQIDGKQTGSNNVTKRDGIRNNMELKNLIENLKEQKQEPDSDESIESPMKKIMERNQIEAQEKINYYNQQKKGFESKMKRVGDIRASNVQQQLKDLMYNLENQKKYILEMEDKKLKRANEKRNRGEEVSDSEDEVKGYSNCKDVATEPDNLIFDLKQVENDLLKITALYEEHQQEMIDKDIKLRRLASQIESMLAVMESDSKDRNKIQRKNNDLQARLNVADKKIKDYEEQINFVKRQYGIDPGQALKQHKRQQQERDKMRQKLGNMNQSDLPAILQVNYEDPRKITDVKKLQDMCVELQEENMELRYRIHELETLLRKHNIVVPPGPASLYSKEALQQMAEQKRNVLYGKKGGKQLNGVQGNHDPFDSFNKDEMLLQGKKLFEKQKKMKEMMDEARKDFHLMSAAEQQKFLQNLSPEQQQEFLNSLSKEQKKVFMEKQMKEGNKEFMEQMMENFDNLDPELQKQFLQNMSKEDQEKFFENKKKYEKEKKEMEQMFEKFNDMSEMEKQKFLAKMTKEEREKFLKKRQQYEEKKSHDQYMEKMAKNYDKLTEKEKQEFLSKMTEEQRQQFFKKKKQMEEKEKEIQNKIKNFDNMTEEEQIKFLNSLSPEEQQKLLKQNKQKFMENMAKNFDNLTAEQQAAFLANLSPEEQKQFLAKKQQIQKQKQIQKEKQKAALEKERQELYKKGIEQMLMEQVMANAKKFYDKKLQTGDDNVESFENEFVTNFYKNQQLKQFKDIMAKGDEIMKKVDQRIKKKEEQLATGKIDMSMLSNSELDKSGIGGKHSQLSQHLKQNQKGKGKAKKKIKVVGADGQVYYVTDSEEEGEVKKNRKKKKKVIGANGEIMYVTDDEPDDPTKPRKKMKRMIGANGEVFYVTDSEEDPDNPKSKAYKEKQKRLKNEERIQKEIERQQKEVERQQKEKQIKEYQLKQQQEMEKKIRDRGNKGGYMDGEDLNQAEMEYLHDMMNKEYQLKGVKMFENKGDNIMNMFQKIFNMKDGQPMPGLEEFQAFMERIQKMHNKCGPNCKHLKRFFARLGLIRRGWWTNREPLKMAQPNVEGQAFKLPRIKKDRMIQ